MSDTSGSAQTGFEEAITLVRRICVSFVPADLRVEQPDGHLVSHPHEDLREATVAEHKSWSERTRIGLSLDYEIADWCRTLGCSEWKLREAVHAVGPVGPAVRTWLARNAPGAKVPALGPY